MVILQIHIRLNTHVYKVNTTYTVRIQRLWTLVCANKDLDGSLGPLGKFIEYCRIVALLPVIPLGIRNNW